MTATTVVSDIERLAGSLRSPADFDPLIQRIGAARLVLLGEASHGTADYYRWRAALTQRLVAEKGFSFVAVEGDWPDCFRLNRWVKDGAGSARHALAGFERWPTWMWANEEVAEFLTWLREHNRRTGLQVGFYGLDVYSLWDSIRVVLDYLTDQHPEALDAAHEAYRCFEPYGEDPQLYARATRLVPTSCEDDVVRLLRELRRKAPELSDPEAELDAQQNAEVLAGAERYYRTMIRADGESWNVRDCHMADTLDRLLTHHGPRSRAVVWEHNTHIGDARATTMGAHGMVNVGQLVRERHSRDGAVLVGFAGHHGSVIASDHWGGSAQRMPVPPAPDGSHEDLLHRALGEPALLVFPDERDRGWLAERRGHRAIGVVYDPDRDPYGNWVPTVMGKRYDALCTFDGTEALHPLKPESPDAELETYPTGR